MIRSTSVGCAMCFEPPGHQADDRQDLVAGHHGRDRPQGADHLDRCRVEPNLLLRLAQRGADQLLARLGPAAGERDLAGVTAHVVAALGEDQAGLVGPVVDRDEDSGILVAVGVERQRLGRVEQHASRRAPRPERSDDHLDAAAVGAPGRARHVGGPVPSRGR